MRQAIPRPRHGLRFWLLSVAAVLLVATGAAAVAIQRMYQSQLKPVSQSDSLQVVTIPLGATVQEIGDNLQSKGVIRKSWAFQWYVRNKDVRAKLQAGTYALRPSQSVQEIVDILATGQIKRDSFTILPGRTLSKVKQDMINGGFAPDDVDAALEPAQYENHPALSDKPKGASLEGYLYPETFQKDANTTPQDIIRASLDQMQLRLTPEVRQAFVAQGLTTHQAVTLASVVESEVGNAADRQKVAQVFLKRLKIGMNLQSDVTVHYGVSVKNDAYNTYAHPGLPVGPISNVSETSINAVAHPAATDYLFFVAGDDGITYFSSTQAEHDQAVRDHCSKERCPAQ